MVKYTYHREPGTMIMSKIHQKVQTRKGKWGDLSKNGFLPVRSFAEMDPGAGSGQSALLGGELAVCVFSQGRHFA